MYLKEQVLIRTSTQADNVYQNQQQQQYHRVEKIVSQSCNASITNTSSRLHPHTPNTEPVHVDHRTVEIETLLHPKLHKKLCTQQAPAEAEIIRTIKYVLIHENLDAHGEIVTDFVQVKFMKKMEHFDVYFDYGDVLPSSTGNANAIFNCIN
ncbi:unnamed protein product [Adineta ricciae]|uniref:Kinesin-like protein Kif23 Arf6-interacting domain-containing protein n=1 Tax=Adineta ricciae TaxID=249248 RepID=A0A815FJI5_ADIRI|nr:unnamed protein product [Adineta ricciae]